MTEGSKRLIIYGFIKDDFKKFYGKTIEERRKQINKWEKEAKGDDKEKRKFAETQLKLLEKEIAVYGYHPIHEGYFPQRNKPRKKALYCGNCGERLESKTKYCIYCGEPL